MGHDGFCGELETKPDSFDAVISTECSSCGESKLIASKTEPSVTISKWNGEAALKFKYLGFAGGSSLDQGRVKWDSADQAINVYPIEEGFELELVLKTIPPTNVFSFEVPGCENYDFIPQPALNTEGREGDGRVITCTEEQCLDKDGNVVMERPADIVDSMAIYAKGKSGTKDGINHQNGKIGHIKRIKVIDANGDWTYGTMKFDPKTCRYDKIIPEDFRLNAPYPIIVDPTFGYTTLGGTQDNTDKFANANLTAAVGSITSGIAGTAYFGGNTDSGGATVYVAVYDQGDSDVSGNNRLAVSAGITLDTTKAFRSAAITCPAISNGSSYYIEAYSNTTGVNTWFDSGLTDEFTNTGVTASPPDPHAARQSTQSNVKVSAYIDCPSASGAGTILRGCTINNGTFR